MTDLPPAGEPAASGIRAERRREVLRSQVPRGERKRRRRVAIDPRVLLVVVLWAVAGGFVAGPFGALGAAVGAGSERRRRGAALVWATTGLALAGVLTLVPHIPRAGSMSPAFANPERLWAARAAAAGAAALLVALGATFGRVASSRDARAPALARERRRLAGWRAVVPVDTAAAVVAQWFAPVGVAVAALALAPGRLPAGYEAARLNAALGDGVMTDAHGVATALHGPLTPVLTAVLPPVLVSALALALCAWAIGSVALLCGAGSVYRARLAAGAVVAASPLMWARQTPELLAAACVAVALRNLTAARRLTPGAALWLAVGTLARPEVGLVLLGAIGFALWEGVGIRRVASAAGVAVLVLAPWALWVHEHVGTWVPTTAIGPALGAAAAADADGDSGGGQPVTLPKVAATAADGEHPHLAQSSALLQAARDDIGSQWAPRSVLARSLRSLSLWTPTGIAESAESRGRIARVVPLAMLADVVMLGAFAWLRWGRTTLDAAHDVARKTFVSNVGIALVVAGIVVSAATYGDPALIAWARVGALAALAIELERRLRGVNVPTLLDEARAAGSVGQRASGVG